MKIWQVVFDYNGDKEIHKFWETSNSDLEKFISDMTKRGDRVLVEKRVIKTL